MANNFENKMENAMENMNNKVMGSVKKMEKKVAHSAYKIEDKVEKFGDVMMKNANKLDSKMKK